MKSKILIFVIASINIISLWYLLLPFPQVYPLPQSVKSDLPGDTVQLSNVAAYYTDLPRSQVIPFYTSTFTSPLRVIINHPPEKAKEIFLPTTQSYYIEEFIIPFKGSLYVNGFEWANDVFTKPEKRIKNVLIYGEKQYASKVTIRTFPVSVPKRLLSFFGLEALIFFLFITYRNVFFRRK